MRVLLIEDEPKVANFIGKGLAENDYTVDICRDGYTGRKKAAEDEYDIIILDIMLPLVNGLDVCRQLRKQSVGVPIFLLSAMGSVDDKVAGLEAGADDYLSKPFHFRELLARVRALTRRQKPGIEAAEIISFGDLHLDTSRKMATRAGKEIILTAKEYALLALLISSPNKVLSKTYIADRIWGIDFDQGTNVVEVYINYLRNKVEKGFAGKLIHTMIGMGYILKEE